MNGTKTTSFRLLLLALVGLCIVGYGVFSFRHVFHGPQFTIEYPNENIIVTDGTLEIKGTVPFATKTTIDGRTLYIDENGAFSETLVVRDGPVIITLYAQDRFGRETTRTVEAYAQKPTPTAQSNQIGL